MVDGLRAGVAWDHDRAASRAWTGARQGREMQVKESGVRVWDEGPEPTWMVMGRRMSQSQSPQGRLWAPVRVSGVRR